MLKLNLSGPPPITVPNMAFDDWTTQCIEAMEKMKVPHQSIGLIMSRISEAYYHGYYPIEALALVFEKKERQAA